MDNSPLLGGEQVEAGQHRGLDGVRELVAAGPLGDRSDELAREEGIAFSMPHDAVDQLGWASLQQPLDQLRRFPIAERLERDGRVVAAAAAPAGPAIQ